MKSYVLGFIFSPDCKQVLLIHKERPENLAGLLNGIGGKIESNETPLDAIYRETVEESNLIITKWMSLGTVSDQEYYVIHCFAACSDNYDKFISKTDEKIGIYRVDELQSLNTVPDIEWMIPLALQKLNKIGENI